MKKKESWGLPSSSFMTREPAVALYSISTPLIVTVLVVSENWSFNSFLSPPPLSSSPFFSGAGAMAVESTLVEGSALVGAAAPVGGVWGAARKEAAAQRAATMMVRLFISPFHLYFPVLPSSD